MATLAFYHTSAASSAVRFIEGLQLKARPKSRLDSVALTPLEVRILTQSGAIETPRAAKERPTQKTAPSWPDATRDDIARILTYNPHSGAIRWAESTGGATAGRLAGTIHHSGYRVICIAGQYVQATQIAWLLHYGERATGRIYFANGNKRDLRIYNLTLQYKRKNPSIYHGLIPTVEAMRELGGMRLRDFRALVSDGILRPVRRGRSGCIFYSREDVERVKATRVAA